MFNQMNTTKISAEKHVMSQELRLIGRKFNSILLITYDKLIHEMQHKSIIDLKYCHTASCDISYSY